MWLTFLSINVSINRRSEPLIFFFLELRILVFLFDHRSLVKGDEYTDPLGKPGSTGRNPHHSNVGIPVGPETCPEQTPPVPTVTSVWVRWCSNLVPGLCPWDWGFLGVPHRLLRTCVVPMGNQVSMFFTIRGQRTGLQTETVFMCRGKMTRM